MGLILEVPPESGNESQIPGRVTGRSCSDQGTAAAEGSGISGLQLCHTKRLRDSTDEPGDGLEAKPALAPGKSLHRGSRCSESALVLPWEQLGCWVQHSLLMACHSPPVPCHRPLGAGHSGICSPANAALAQAATEPLVPGWGW